MEYTLSFTAFIQPKCGLLQYAEARKVHYIREKSLMLAGSLVARYHQSTAAVKRDTLESHAFYKISRFRQRYK